LFGPRGNRLVWHWYQVRGYATTRGVAIRLHEALALLRGDGRGSLLVAVSAEAGATLDRTRSALSNFVSVLPTEFIARD